MSQMCVLALLLYTWTLLMITNNYLLKIAQTNNLCALLFAINIII